MTAVLSHYAQRRKRNRAAVEKYLQWANQLQECPVFYPTEEEFGVDPMAYIAKIAEVSEPFGICKIVPPVVGMGGLHLASAELRRIKFSTRTQRLRTSRGQTEFDQVEIVVILPCCFGVVCKRKKGGCREFGVQFNDSGRRYSLAQYESAAAKKATQWIGTTAPQDPRLIEVLYGMGIASPLFWYN